MLAVYACYLLSYTSSREDNDNTRSLYTDFNSEPRRFSSRAASVFIGRINEMYGGVISEGWYISIVNVYEAGTVIF